MFSRMLVIGITILSLGIAQAVVVPWEDTIELTKANSVVLRGPVTGSSVAAVQVELLAKAKAGKDIYLVLDTPGGSVFAGNELIQFVKGLPVKVKTVTLFAASMGFHIAQSLDTRYIVENGILMSHRATTGMEGEIPGELLTRLDFLLSLLNSMDDTAAKRMTQTTKHYQSMIRDEYWVRGSTSVKHKAADKVVTVRCGNDRQGTEQETFNTIFGPATVTFSACPLIGNPLSVQFDGKVSAADKAKIQRYIDLVYTNKAYGVTDYIKNGKYRDFQR